MSDSRFDIDPAKEGEQLLKEFNRPDSERPRENMASVMDRAIITPFSRPGGIEARERSPGIRECAINPHWIFRP